MLHFFFLSPGANFIFGGWYAKQTSRWGGGNDNNSRFRKCGHQTAQSVFAFHLRQKGSCLTNLLKEAAEQWQVSVQLWALKQFLLCCRRKVLTHAGVGTLIPHSENWWVGQGPRHLTSPLHHTSNYFLQITLGFTEMSPINGNAASVECLSHFVWHLHHSFQKSPMAIEWSTDTDEGAKVEYHWFFFYAKVYQWILNKRSLLGILLERPTLSYISN